MEYFNAKLKTQLKKYGMSQATLAKLVGVSTTTVNRWCQGIQEPGSENMERIAQVLNTDVNALFGFSHVEEPEIIQHHRIIGEAAIYQLLMKLHASGAFHNMTSHEHTVILINKQSHQIEAYYDDDMLYLDPTELMWWSDDVPVAIWDMPSSAEALRERCEKVLKEVMHFEQDVIAKASDPVVIFEEFGYNTYLGYDITYDRDRFAQYKDGKWMVFEDLESYARKRVSRFEYTVLVPPAEIIRDCGLKLNIPE